MRPGPAPEIVAGTEFRDSFGVALSIITGAHAKAERQKATEAFKPILAKATA